MSSITTYIAWDIETPGSLSHNRPFAIGYAVGQNNTVMEKGSLNCKMPLDNLSNIYEERCWNEFWSKHVNILQMLNDRANCDSFDDLSVKFNKELVRLENKYENIVHVFDTIHFDPLFLNTELMRNTNHYMWRNRSGDKWYYTIDINSYAMGMENVLGGDFKNIRDTARNEAAKLVSHNHDPADDAEYILRTLFALSHKK